MKPLFTSLMLIVFCTGFAAAQDGFVDGVQLTTIKAPWTLRILGQDLDISNVQVKPDEASAYFMMTSKSTTLNVSVFIEPVDKCSSSEGCRDYVLGLGNPAWGKYQDLAKGKIKDFSDFEFYIPEVEGKPVKIFDMYAEFVSNGYWVDMHISKPLYERKDHALFEAVVNSTTFLPSAGNSADAYSTEVATGEKASSLWLPLWDSEKCPESYAALAAVTRADITEKDWTDYCTSYAGGLGKNTKRRLIASAFTRSLPPKTDLPVAVFTYQSDFANKTGLVELLALMREKDGKWAVTNHLFQ